MSTQNGRAKVGCMKPIAIVIGAFFILMGLVTACGPDEVEVPGPEVTVTKTTTARASTVTVTETTTEETTAEEPEPVAAIEPTSEPELEAPNPVQRGAVGGANAPAPAPATVQAPAPAPAPTPIGRTITAGAFCKNAEIGQTGQTSTGLTKTCTPAPVTPKLAGANTH